MTLSTKLIILCRYCETEIIQTHPNRKVCLDCKRERNRKAQLKKYQKNSWYSPKKDTKQCIVCGDDFFGISSVTCSHRCRQIRVRLIQRLDRKFSKIKVNLFKSWVMWGERR